MQLRITLTILLIVNVIIVCAQQSISYENVDKGYRVFLPAEWELQKEDKPSGFILLKAHIPEKDELLRPFIQIETELLGMESSTTNLREFAKNAINAEKKKGGNFLSILSDTIKKINNKEWWERETSFKMNKRNIINEYILRTLHNSTVITLRFNGFEKYYNQYKDIAIPQLQSFLLYTHDNATYKGQTMLSAALIAKNIKQFEGSYTSKEKPDNVTMLTITDLKNGNYSAIAQSAITRDGQKFVYNSILIIDSIDENQIVLSDDAVSLASREIGWAKGSYRLMRSPNMLEGISFSNSNAFPLSQINFEKEAKGNIAAQSSKTPSSTLKKEHKSIQEINIDTMHKPYTYTYFVPDYSMNGQLALMGKIPVGATVGIIDFDAGNTYTVKTKMQKKADDECLGLFTFTTIDNPPPPLLSTYQGPGNPENADRGIIAMLNYQNLPFNLLKTVRLAEKTVLQNLHEKIIKSSEYRKFAAGEKNMPIDTAFSNAVRRNTPVVNEIDIKGMVVRLVEYEVGLSIRFIEINGQIFWLNSYGFHPNQKVTFYKFGNNYFLHFGEGTGQTENVIYEIRPNGLKKECFFKAEC